MDGLIILALCVAIFLVIGLLDSLRVRRAELLSKEGRCAKCGTRLIGPGERIAIERHDWYAVCKNCSASDKRQWRAVLIIIVLAFVSVFLLLWLSH